MTQNQPTQIYFLAPGWDITPSSAVLGSIVTKPSEPNLAFFRPPAASITTATTASSPVSFDSTGVSSSASASASASAPAPAGLFRTFLSAYGLGDNEPSFTFDRKRVVSYSFRGHRSVELAASPPPELLRTAVADPRVKELVAGGVGVYMITGIRTVAGAGVKVASAKGAGWLVDLGVGSAGAGADKGVAGEEDSSRVFALQVAEVKVEEGGGGEVVLRQFSGGASGLQAELDEKYGGGTFKVAEGFDEVVGPDTEGGRCLIVTATPILVDPLTAGTRKVGGEHGIWA